MLGHVMRRALFVPSVHDPYFSSVASLNYYSGANGSTAFADVIAGNTITTTGTPVITTATAPFGAGSLDTTSGIVTTTGTYSIGTGSFTYDIWFSVGTSNVSYNNLMVTNAASIMVARFGNAGFNDLLQFALNSTSTSSCYSLNRTMASFVGTGWHLFSMQRSGSTVTAYLDGVQQNFGTGGPATTFPYSSISDTTNCSCTQIVVGADAGAGLYISNSRLTVGVARYSGNFTPPAVNFPNH